MSSVLRVQNYEGPRNAADKLLRHFDYRIKLDRWPRHVTPSEKRSFLIEITLFSTSILGQKVDRIRNVTASQSHVLGQKVDRIRNVTASQRAFLLFLNSFFDHIPVFEQFWVTF